VAGPLEERIGGLARGRPAGPPAPDLTGAFLVGREGPVEGAFTEAEGRLVREKGGRAGSLPAWVRRIHLVRPGDPPPHLAEEDLAAFLPPAAGGDPGPWLGTCRPLERDRLRLAPTGTGTVLERPGVLPFLQTLWPELGPLLEAVLGWERTCAHPLEEMYAGNSLPDRNGELVENILP
jgi:hypothetical protein